MDKESEHHLFNTNMRAEYPVIERAEGIYLYGEDGRRWIDGTGGPMACPLGHGNEEMIAALTEQAKKVAYLFRHEFTTRAIEEAAQKLCECTNGDMGRVFFVSGGSEATEMAVKIARKYHLERGNTKKYKIIARWQSYHGITQGALSWSGMTARRADYIPMLPESSHVAPAYCYRCWYRRTPDSCAVDCAQALETEILCQGPDNVAAFMAEPLPGMSLCAAMPHPDYFKRIREICDKYDVLLILDEVMTGFGRTGEWFGYQNFDFVPDIIACGKGMGGGYFPIGAVLVKDEIYDTIRDNSGLFGSGHTWGGNPMAGAVVSKNIDLFKELKLIDRVRTLGKVIQARLEKMADEHPSIGDVRGRGLMWGIEFVQDKESKACFPAEEQFSLKVKKACKDAGLCVEASSGCDRGAQGDMMMIGPPFIATEAEVNEIMDILEHAITDTERSYGM